MKRIIFTFIIAGLFITVDAQKYITRNGYTGFFSSTPLEDIKADNNQVACILDASTGNIVFQVLIRSFRFEKALMEEHFNENYLESEKFPKSTFEGKITNISDVDFSKNGIYNVTVNGDLSIHGVTKPVRADGTIEVASDGITASSKFNLVPEEYNIKIPGVVRNNIAKTIEITVRVKFPPL